MKGILRFFGGMAAVLVLVAAGWFYWNEPVRSAQRIYQKVYRETIEPLEAAETPLSAMQSLDAKAFRSSCLQLEYITEQMKASGTPERWEDPAEWMEQHVRWMKKFLALHDAYQDTPAGEIPREALRDLEECYRRLLWGKRRMEGRISFGGGTGLF